MATVITEFSMSLDGFIAESSGGVGSLFDWYDNGPVEVHSEGAPKTFHLTGASAPHLREMIASTGAIVTGRRTFDITGGFAGGHPYDAPIFVVTHDMPPGRPRDDGTITIVTDGLESAIAQACAVAGDRVVIVGAASIARQCVEAGLLDEIRINLVPVLMGEGIRFIDALSVAPVELGDPRVVEGTRVTHLYYRVKPAVHRSSSAGRRTPSPTGE